MLIGGLRQLLAAPQSSALQHRAPIGCRHALAKAMHAHAAADLRLIRTFGHSTFLISKNNGGWLLQTGTTLYRRASDSVNLDSSDLYGFLIIARMSALRELSQEIFAAFALRFFR